MQEHITARLLGSADLGALVGTRIHWGRLPPGVTALPYVILQVISGPRDYHSTGASGLIQSRLQVDSYGESADDAAAVHRAVEDLLSGYKGAGQGVIVQGAFLENERDLNSKTVGGETLLFRKSDDFTINWQRG